MSTAEAYPGEVDDIYALANALINEGLKAKPLSDSFLTFEGLVMAIDKNPPNFFLSPQGQNFFRVLANKMIVPLLIKEDGGQQVYYFGICISESRGEMRNPMGITFALDEILCELPFPLTKEAENVHFIILTLREFSDLLKPRANLIADKKARQIWLSEIDEKTTAQEAVMAMMKHLVARGGSDIHVECNPPRIRYRIDGLIQVGKYPSLTIGRIKKIIAVIMNMAEMQMDDHKHPQDGRITFTPEQIAENPTLKGIGFRAAFQPVVIGQEGDYAKTVLRLLRNQEVVMTIKDLGLTDITKAQFIRVLDESRGMLIVNGPTGSGKTTTLYAGVRYLNTGEDGENTDTSKNKNAGDKNICTIEDPPEILLSGVNQTQINPKIGNTFTSGLKAVLRQDPDVIMVGEIREPESAVIATEAAITGHLVLATLHADDTITSYLRLRGLGVSGDMLSAALRAIISQRLARRICPQCASFYQAEERLRHLLGLPIDFTIRLPKANIGSGCPHCGGMGYKGRILLPEFLAINDDIKELMNRDVQNYSAYLEAAIKRGFKPMAVTAAQILIEGKTDLTELIRVGIREDDFMRCNKILYNIFKNASQLQQSRKK